MTTREITYVEALREAMAQEMRRDATVIVIGEDVAGGAGRGEGGASADAWGGPFGKTKGLIGEFGEARVKDAPLSETAFVGMSIGAASVGLRPVVDLMFSDFLGVCFDQVMNQAAKLRTMSGGAVRIPMVISMASGGGIAAGAQHSGAIYALATHIAGLKVVAPATPADAKGLMAAAIRDDDPVLVFEHKRLYGLKGPVPEGEHVTPIGKAHVVRAGRDVTLVGMSGTVSLASDAAAALAEEGVDAEVIDLRSLSPIDWPTIEASVRKTRRLVVADEAGPRCGLASDVAGWVASTCFTDLVAAPQLVTGAHAPVPFSPTLEALALPDAARIVQAARRTLDRATAAMAQA